VELVAAGIATVLAVVLVFVQPLAGRRRYAALVERVARDPGARLRHYRRGIAGEWITVGIIVAIGLLAGRTAASIGLQAPQDSWFTAQLVGEIALLLVITTLFMRHPRFLDPLRRQARGFLALLPRTREERLTFAVLAVTAGICEEIVFRGFGFAYVRFIWPGVTDGWLIVITSAVFGLAHLYQGPRGVVLTGLAGGAFASMTITTGSLLPAIAVHAMVDLRILGLPDLVRDVMPAPAPTAPTVPEPAAVAAPAVQSQPGD
jgi:membrane protease YdiL (CAAX protease family)